MHVLGYTQQLPTEDRYLTSRSQIKDMLAGMLAGHAAEEIIFNEVTTGAANDIEQATKLARAMVTRFGMSDKLGTRTFGQKEELVFLGREISEQKDYSDETARQIDEEIHNFIKEAHDLASSLLIKNKSKLTHIAEKLIEKETLEGEELEAVLKETAPKPKVKTPIKTKPVPVEPVQETKTAPKRVPKKTPPVPELLTEQTPAPSD
jgi:cell division protease FtsH